MSRTSVMRSSEQKISVFRKLWDSQKIWKIRKYFGKSALFFGFSHFFSKIRFSEKVNCPKIDLSLWNSEFSFSSMKHLFGNFSTANYFASFQGVGNCNGILEFNQSRNRFNWWIIWQVMLCVFYTIVHCHKRWWTFSCTSPLRMNFNQVISVPLSSYEYHTTQESIRATPSIRRCVDGRL